MMSHAYNHNSGGFFHFCHTANWLPPLTMPQPLTQHRRPNVTTLDHQPASRTLTKPFQRGSHRERKSICRFLSPGQTILKVGASRPRPPPRHMSAEDDGWVRLSISFKIKSNSQLIWCAVWGEGSHTYTWRKGLRYSLLDAFSPKSQELGHIENYGKKETIFFVNFFKLLMQFFWTFIIRLRKESAIEKSK